jgi:hypothetical protein
MELKLHFPETEVYGTADPFGNIVFFAEDFAISDNNNQNIHQLTEAATAVIEKPIYIISIGSSDLFYFRRINSNTMLVHSKFKSLEWEAKKMIQDPHPDYIFTLLKKGRLYTSFD